MEAADLRLGLCTVPDRDSGMRMARALVSERLAACVNVVGGVTSVYRWQGELASNDEVLLIIKTSRQVNEEKLKDRILTLHPYDVPELLLLPVQYGLNKYIDWIAQSVSDVVTEPEL